VVRLQDDGAWLRATPALFVLIWSTGFLAARYGMPHAPPLTFLAWRFGLSMLAFGVWLLLSRASWPQSRAQWMHLVVAGVLLHAGYLGGVWAAVKAGMTAGTVALIVGLQPVLTALWLFGSSRVVLLQWLGLFLGFAGLALVVWPKVGVGELTAWNVGLAALALLCITAGTLYQKRFVQAGDVRMANAVQIAAAFVVTLPLALFETEPMRWHPQLIGALAWSVLVLTLGGSSLLVLLIQRGAAMRVTSLLYLVPPCTAVLAWWLFGEPLTPAVVAGMALTAIGVACVLRPGASVVASVASAKAPERMR
jgi:drug/metabolite transporter (DMT)-like permease